MNRLGSSGALRLPEKAVVLGKAVDSNVGARRRMLRFFC